MVGRAARLGEVVVVSVPFGRFREIPAAPLAGKVVIDTNNYYPQRDGRWPELDDDSTTSSELLAGHLGDSAHVVQPDTPPYGPRMTAAELREALG
jgi:8-hydroxy-5-deazaflavin:NADPH oxidoreductase